MSVISPQWLSLSGEANNLRSTYIDGFLDVSSSRGVLLRSDVSFGGNVVLSRSNFTGTVSPNSTAATSATWSNNGISWASSASGFYPLGDPYFAFNAGLGSVDSDLWHSIVGTFTATTSIYNTGSSGTATNYTGEWLQIQSSVPVVMKDFKMYPRIFNSAVQGRMPKVFYIVGSNTGSGTWTPIIYCTTTATTGTASPTGTVTLSGLLSSGSGTISNFYSTTSLTYTTYGNLSTSFTYFRLCVGSVLTNDNTINIAEWNINFSPATQAITLAPSTTAYGQLNLTGGLTSLGIGTNSPGGRLHIGSDVGNLNYLQIQNTLTTTWGSADLYNNTRYIKTFGGAEHSKEFNVGPGGVGIGFAPPTYDKGGIHALYVNGYVGIGTASPQATLDVNGTIGFSYSSLPTLASNHIGYTVSYPLSIQGTTYTGVNLFDINLGIGVWLIQSYIRTSTAQNNGSYLDCNINSINWPVGITTFASSQTAFGPSAVVMNITAATFVRTTLSLSANTQFNNAWFKATRIA